MRPRPAQVKTVEPRRGWWHPPSKATFSMFPHPRSLSLRERDALAQLGPGEDFPVLRLGDGNLRRLQRGPLDGSGIPKQQGLHSLHHDVSFWGAGAFDGKGRGLAPGQPRLNCKRPFPFGLRSDATGANRDDTCPLAGSPFSWVGDIGQTTQHRGLAKPRRHAPKQCRWCARARPFGAGSSLNRDRCPSVLQSWAQAGPA